jgi:hypothetical protein
VWAVDYDHLGHYLVPRECPRVCFRRSTGTTDPDLRRFLGTDPSAKVVAIEASWFERAHEQALWLYEMPNASFECQDANAGYYVSPKSVMPTSVVPISAPVSALREGGYELRVLPRLRDLAHEVAQSSLAFSVIRLRNAA